MVVITAAAEQQITQLEEYYARQGRDLAVIRMTEAIAMAVTRIEQDAGPFFSAPRPYPALSVHGWRWLKQWRYWIAFCTGCDGHAVTAVFFETADIPHRIETPDEGAP